MCYEDTERSLWGESWGDGDIGSAASPAVSMRRNAHSPTDFAHFGTGSGSIDDPIEILEEEWPSPGDEPPCGSPPPIWQPYTPFTPVPKMKETLEVLSSSGCIVCWLLGRGGCLDHCLGSCRSADRLATRSDKRFRDFKESISYPEKENCYACGVKLKVGFFPSSTHDRGLMCISYSSSIFLNLGRGFKTFTGQGGAIAVP